MLSSNGNGSRPGTLPFLAGVTAGALGAVLVQSLWPRPTLDRRLIPWDHRDPDVLPVVVVPGILGSELVRPDGTQVWLNIYNAFGSHDLSLPCVLPFCDSRDDLVPGG